MESVWCYPLKLCHKHLQGFKERPLAAIGNAREASSRRKPCPSMGRGAGRSWGWLGKAPQEMSWLTNYSFTSFQPVGNGWKSRVYFRSRNSLATFANTSGDLCFSFFGHFIDDFWWKVWGIFFFSFWWGSLTNSLAVELFLLERWRTGLIIPVGKVSRQFFFSPTQSWWAHTNKSPLLSHLLADSVTWSKFLHE